MPALAAGFALPFGAFPAFGPGAPALALPQPSPLSGPAAPLSIPSIPGTSALSFLVSDELTDPL